jgi:hypothetical protein
MFAIDLFYKFNFGNSGLGIVAGPSIGINLTGTMDESFYIVDPVQTDGKLIVFDKAFLEAEGRILPEQRFEDSDTRLIFSEGDIVDKSGTRFGLKIGAQYELSVPKLLFRPAVVVPHVIYDIGLTTVNTTDDWRVSALQLGVDIRFAL